MSSILSAAALGLSSGGVVLLGVPSPASAGVGAVAPFDSARKELYPGAIKASVASLRITSALRWINTSETRRKANMAYARPWTTIVGGYKSTDDSTLMEDTLAGIVGKEYGGSIALGTGANGAPVDLGGDLTKLAAQLPEKAKGGDGNLVVVYGPHVGISKEGKLGEVEVERDAPSAVSEYASSAGGDDRAVIAATKAAFKSARDKAEGQVPSAGEIRDLGVGELTLVGGITINRAKFGKDKGEDWFYPLSAKTYMADGTVLDKYEGAFGDLGIPNKDRN